jgi:hypothetical protein
MLPLAELHTPDLHLNTMVQYYSLLSTGVEADNRGGICFMCILYTVRAEIAMHVLQ